jgi:hypothetical protein
MFKCEKTKVKQTIRRIIIDLPGGETILRLRWLLMEYCRLARMGNAKNIFHHHYNINWWGNPESVSGAGSTIRYTENIRKELPKLLSDLDAEVFLDAPCGDYNWMRVVAWKIKIDYIGGDIVEPLIKRNQSLYSSHNVKFINLDIVHDVLPKADLWLCRDCLFHLSNRNIMLAIDNFIRSDIPYLLTSTFPHCEKNYDIPTGSFRSLNLELPPFCFGKPITQISDWIEGCPVRYLGLWEREALKTALASNKAFQRAVKQRKD